MSSGVCDKIANHVVNEIENMTNKVIEEENTNHTAKVNRLRRMVNARNRRVVAQRIRQENVRFEKTKKDISGISEKLVSEKEGMIKEINEVLKKHLV
jgi:hypothetical protein